MIGRKIIVKACILFAGRTNRSLQIPIKPPEFKTSVHQSRVPKAERRNIKWRILLFNFHIILIFKLWICLLQDSLESGEKLDFFKAFPNGKGRVFKAGLWGSRLLSPQGGSVVTVLEERNIIEAMTEVSSLEKTIQNP